MQTPVSQKVEELKVGKEMRETYNGNLVLAKAFQMVTTLPEPLAHDQFQYLGQNRPRTLVQIAHCDVPKVVASTLTHK